MDDLAVLVPSRGRPHNIERLLEAMDKTCRGETRLCIGVDADDPCVEAYRAFSHRCDFWVSTEHQGRLVDWLNLLADDYEMYCPYLGHIGDDNVPQTDGWDVRIMESLEKQGEVGFCFGNDLDPGRAPGSLSIHIFMTSEVIRRLGYMGPPSIQHMYVDPVWYAWGQATSIEYLDDVILEHMHYSLGRAPMDESYHHSTGLIPADCTRYNDYCDTGLNEDIAKLGGRPFTVEELAEFNHRLNIPRRWAA